MPSSRHFTQSFGIATIAALAAIPLASRFQTARGARSLTVDVVGEYCSDCHDAVTQSGGVVLDAAGLREAIVAVAAIFADDVDRQRTRAAFGLKSTRDWNGS